MKRIFQIARPTLMGLALVGLILSPGFLVKTLAADPKGLTANTLHFRNSDKKVDITVELHGKIDGYTVASVEALLEPWLEAAHFAVVNADGVNILELHITINVDDDGKGWHISSGCGQWEEDRDAHTLDTIDDILHEIINDFIDNFVH
jgi:hypothetical protein